MCWLMADSGCIYLLDLGLRGFDLNAAYKPKAYAIISENLACHYMGSIIMIDGLLRIICFVVLCVSVGQLNQTIHG